MSNTDNFVFVTGQLLFYEERVVGKGTVSRLRVKVPSGMKNKEATFAVVDVDAWNLNDELKKSLNDSAGKANVSVQGAFRQDTWKDKKTGANRSKLFVNAQHVFVNGTFVEDQSQPVVQQSVVSSSVDAPLDIPF